MSGQLESLNLDFSGSPEPVRSVIVTPPRPVFYSSYTMRDYQIRASDAAFELWKTIQAVLVVMATGLGKTVLAADVIRRMQPGRTLFLAHREELIFQAANKIREVTGLGCEIEMADLRASASLFNRSEVIVSTIQTQVSGRGQKRMERFKPDDFALIVVDETHHAPASTYRACMDYYKQNPNLKILGITATPDRTDELALGQIFQHVAINFGILEGVENGWLVPISQQLVKIKDLDFSGVRTTAGDLNGKDLAMVMEEEKPLHGVVGAALEIIGDRRAIIFAAGVKHAERISEIMNRPENRPGCCEWICGETPKEDRRDRLKRFSAGAIQVMANCGVLTEGFDDPGVEFIIMARPTKSRSLYTQMVGRMTRPLPGVVDGPPTAIDRIAAIEASRKATCTVIDFTGNSGRHKLITAADILGGRFPEEVRERAKKILEKKPKGDNVQGALIEAERELLREKQERDRRDAARRDRIKARVTYTTKEINPFDRTQTDTFQSGISRDGRKFSPSQTGILAKNGFNPAKITYGQGQAIIGKIMSKPSDGQRKCLIRNGYGLKEVDAMSRKEASKTIDVLAANGWRRPIAPKITPEDVPNGHSVGIKTHNIEAEPAPDGFGEENPFSDE